MDILKRKRTLSPRRKKIKKGYMEKMGFKVSYDFRVCIGRNGRGKEGPEDKLEGQLSHT